MNRTAYPPTIVIAGPTASGKTAVAAALARLAGGEIISADSRQVYRFLDIGTNKEGRWDGNRGVRVVAGTPQHLTDLVEPSDTYSAGEFARASREIIARLGSEGKLPIVAGGTGLYLTALIDGLAPLPPGDDSIRKELRDELAASGLERLYDRLHAADPESAEKNRQNPQRLIRALEVYLLTGTPLSAWHRLKPPQEGKFLQFGLRRDREEMYRVIDRRADEMLAKGMIEETRGVLARGYSPDSPGLQGLGYADIVRCLAGEIDRSALAENLKRDTRRYAKRQMTWFRRDDRIEWFEVRETSFDPEAIALTIFKKL